MRRGLRKKGASNLGLVQLRAKPRLRCSYEAAALILGGLNVIADGDIRLHVRIDARISVPTPEHPEATHGHISSLDVSVPTAASFADALPELLTLANAPTISVPWQVVTGAGQPLDSAVPLHATRLRHGDLVVIRPQRSVPNPVVQDAAEACAALARSSKPVTGTAEAATLTGLCCVTLVLLAASRMPSLGLPSVVPLIAAALLWGLAACKSGSGLLLGTAPGVVALAGWSAIAHQGPGHHALAIGVGALCGLVGAALCWVMVGKAHGLLLPITACVTALCCAGAAMLGPALAPASAGFARWGSGACASVLVICLLVSTFTPSLARILAGLKVPVLPAAGEALPPEAEETPDLRANATAAIDLLNGMHLGVAIAGVPAALGLGLPTLVGLLPFAPEHAQPSGYVAALLLTTMAATTMHAHRYHHPKATWALWLVGLASLVSAAFLCLSLASWWLLAVTGALALLLSAAMHLSQRLAWIAPTTMVWVERAEALCVAASLPLALQVLGVFSMLRGLGVGV